MPSSSSGFLCTYLITGKLSVIFRAKKITDLFCYLYDKGSELEDTQRTTYQGYETKIYPALKYYMIVNIREFRLG
jgi:hypothetical protein